MVKKKVGSRQVRSGWGQVEIMAHELGSCIRDIRLPLSCMYVLTAYFLWPSFLFSQEVGLTASSERKNLRLGEPVIVTITARVPAALDTLGPIPTDSVGLFEVLSVTKEEDEHRWSFRLMTIDTGTVFLPPIGFAYTTRGDSTAKTAYANSLAFTVSGVTVAPDADIKDIRPPLSAPWTWEDLWPFLLVAVLLAGGWYAYRRYRAAHPVGMEELPPAPAVAPHVQALKELRLLEEKQLWQQGKVKEYYSEATEIVRRFFEGRWNIPALEMTSDEILHALRSTKEAEALGVSLGSFFIRADMVKFAKAQPTPDNHREELEEAFSIVRAMTPQEAAPPVTEPAKETADVR